MYAELLGAVDYTGVIVGMVAMAALMAVVKIARKGYVWLLSVLGYKDMGEGYSTKSSVSVDSRGEKTVTLRHIRH